MRIQSVEGSCYFLHLGGGCLHTVLVEEERSKWGGFFTGSARGRRNWSRDSCPRPLPSTFQEARSVLHVLRARAHVGQERVHSRFACFAHVCTWACERRGLGSSLNLAPLMLFSCPVPSPQNISGAYRTWVLYNLRFHHLLYLPTKRRWGGRFPGAGHLIHWIEMNKIDLEQAYPTCRPRQL